MSEIRVTSEATGVRRVDVICDACVDGITLGRGPTREAALESARVELGRLTAEVDELAEDED